MCSLPLECVDLHLYLTEAISYRKLTLFLPAKKKKPKMTIAPGIGLECHVNLYFPFRDWSVLNLHRCHACCHNCCDFKCKATLLCPEDILYFPTAIYQLWFLHFSRSCSTIIAEPWDEGVQYVCSI